MDIGLCIKQQRQKLGMTQEELSELSGVSRVSIGNYERGDREPTVSIAIAIAESLGVTFEELVCVIHEEFDKLPKGSHVLSKEQTDKLFFHKPNLLEIKLKDTDSIPEVYYKGERLDESPRGLVDILYHWKTDGFADNDYGANDISIEYYETPNNKYPDRKTIRHKRDM